MERKQLFTKSYSKKMSWQSKLHAIGMIALILGAPNFGCQKVQLETESEKALLKPNLNTLSSTTTVTDDEFTIAVLGDTQNYVDYSNEEDPDADCQDYGPLGNAISWIVDNKTTENIKYVVQVGDLTDNYATVSTGVMEQWERASDQLFRLKTAGIPFGVVPGNHDVRINDASGITSFPASQYFHTYFGRPQFPTSYNIAGFPNPSSNQNHYDVINTPAGEFIILYLRWQHLKSEFDPALAWAKTVMDLPANQNRKAILVTHYVVENPPGSLAAPNNNPAPDGKTDWGMQRYIASNPYSQAEMMYETFKDYPNFFMMLGGHVGGDGERFDTYNGITVKSFTTDYSNSCGSSGYPQGLVRTMTFSASKDKITFKTFVPGQPAFRTFERPWYHGFNTSRTNDYENDGKSQLSFFNNTNGLWKMAGLTDVTYGVANDIPVPGDYNADGKTERAVFHAGTSWQISGGATVAFGLAGDIPTPGDFDGNGFTDMAVYRPSEGKWYVKQPYNAAATTQVYGQSTYIPVPGDYDGDGKTDFAWFNPADAEWGIYSIVRSVYGEPGVIPVPGDYNGAGKYIRAYFKRRQATDDNAWYIFGVANPVIIGKYGDIPVPGDYNGDGKTDIAVYRPSDGTFIVNGQAPVSTGVINGKPVNLPYHIRKFFFP